MEHGEHAVGEGESAEYVDAGDEDGDEGQGGDECVVCGDLGDGSDDDDSGDGVGDAHEGGVEGVVDAADDVEADDYGEGEYDHVG